MGYVSVANILTNNSTNSPSDVNTNFSNVVDGISDGTKDFNMGNMTIASNLTCVGNVSVSDSLSCWGLHSTTGSAYAASGNVQGDCPISHDYVLVTSKGGNKYITLPTPSTGRVVTVLNKISGAGGGIFIYVPSGKYLNSSLNGNVATAADVNRSFMAVDGNNWWYY
jgi:hypothetical protein